MSIWVAFNSVPFTYPINNKTWRLTLGVRQSTRHVLEAVRAAYPFHTSRRKTDDIFRDQKKKRVTKYRDERIKMVLNIKA